MARASTPVGTRGTDPAPAQWPEWPSQREITDRRAVLMLSDLRALKYLTPFLVDAQTLSSAARALDVRTSTVAYWIPRFVDVGLLVHLGDQTRAGMAMPTYRAPARQLVVPFGALPFAQRVSLLDGGRMRVLRRFLDGLDEAIERDRSMALGFSSHAPKGFAIEMVAVAGRRPTHDYTDGWRTLELTAADATTLSGEIDALFERYAGRNGPRKYVVHGGIAPDARVRWRSVDDDIPG